MLLMEALRCTATLDQACYHACQEYSYYELCNVPDQSHIAPVHGHITSTIAVDSMSTSALMVAKTRIQHVYVRIATTAHSITWSIVVCDASSSIVNTASIMC
eukprot:2768-Heterococcus_DN1.PRE.1